MGLNINEFVDNLECEDKYKNIITVEHRHNNSKRDFLFCNKLQGKHIPVNPVDAFSMFRDLAHKVNETLKNHKILIVGFAETATAIGSYLADNVDNCVYYLQTTREENIKTSKMIEFSEEHSHATEQYLYMNPEVIPEFDYVLLVDDEITTGNTVINFVKEFSKYYTNIKYGVASICNWQSKEDVQQFNEFKVDRIYLISGQIKDINYKMDVDVLPSISAQEQYKLKTLPSNLPDQTIKITTAINIHHIERAGHKPNYNGQNMIVKYIKEEIQKKLETGDKNILIIGTEEFMYVPMKVGYRLATENNYNVRTHSTSRSHIDAISDGTDKYGIKACYNLRSPYGFLRETFIYNLDKYDKVFIITDSEHGFSKFILMLDIFHYLNQVGNDINNIYFVETSHE